jgi:hypothetical protein
VDYVQSDDLVELHPGDRLFIPCRGGSSVSRLERYPPPLEIAERGGLYVLIDDGCREDWHYLSVPDEPVG